MGNEEEYKAMNVRLQKMEEAFCNMENYTDKFYDVFNKGGFCPARMICGSKSYFHKSCPTHVAIFNANICTKEHGKIWHGDIDLTSDEKKLKKVSAEIGVPLYVLYEMDGRFENAKKPLIDQALFKITEKETTLIRVGYDKFYVKRRGKWRSTRD